jgi:hypothetical protein
MEPPRGPSSAENRSWVLNGELSSRFRKWYPDLPIVEAELKTAE